MMTSIGLAGTALLFLSLSDGAAESTIVGMPAEGFHLVRATVSEVRGAGNDTDAFIQVARVFTADKTIADAFRYRYLPKFAGSAFGGPRPLSTGPAPQAGETAIWFLKEVRGQLVPHPCFVWGIAFPSRKEISSD